ncbi:dTDP-4-dehydrorhamnose reductase [Flavobacteriaceae bacterium]|nr:dTDP-4-dehydrorhamnose reductase [Flavobacteriaceae bacterium]
MKILVTGRSGQLGSELYKISSKFNFDWIFTNRHTFDLSDLDNINEYLNKYKPDLLINCAAYTDVDNAEYDFTTADILNHKAIKLIAKWCNVNLCKLIHISTDYVYNPDSLKPSKEDDFTNPLGNYGKTKLLGDIACSKYNYSSVIIRTSWLYSTFGNNFLKIMINLMKKKGELKIVNDQIGSPTYAGDLAEVILCIIDHKKWKPGIYNYSSVGAISWFDYANYIKSLYGFNTELKPISTIEYSQNNIRPKYSLLDNSKIINTFNINQINYKDSLKKCIKILQNES